MDPDEKAKKDKKEQAELDRKAREEREQRRIAAEQANPVGTFFKNLFMFCGTADNNDPDERRRAGGEGCCVG